MSAASTVRACFQLLPALWTEAAWFCGQICNQEFLKDQQRSTTHEMQPADSAGDNLYTKTITHLIPNQIPKPIEVC